VLLEGIGSRIHPPGQSSSRDGDGPIRAACSYANRFTGCHGRSAATASDFDSYGVQDAESLLLQIDDCQTYIAVTSRAQLSRPGQPEPVYAHHRRAISWAENDRTLLHEHWATFLADLT
jgi:hypothetical protein